MVCERGACGKYRVHEVMGGQVSLREETPESLLPFLCVCLCVSGGGGARTQGQGLRMRVDTAKAVEGTSPGTEWSGTGDFPSPRNVGRAFRPSIESRYSFLPCPALEVNGVVSTTAAQTGCPAFPQMRIVRKGPLGWSLALEHSLFGKRSPAAQSHWVTFRHHLPLNEKGM